MTLSVCKDHINNNYNPVVFLYEYGAWKIHFFKNQRRGKTFPSATQFSVFSELYVNVSW